MLLNEMFSPLGSPQENDQDIDWAGDLKFFMDNDDTMLTQYLFPTVKKHLEHRGNPNAYKLYIPALNKVKECYCKQFNVEDIDEKLDSHSLTELAKAIANEQEQFIENGDYDEDL